MLIGILKENNDNRAVMIPEIAGKLVSNKNTVWVEEGAGKGAFYSDENYIHYGAVIVKRDELISKSELLLSINPVEDREIQGMSKGAIYVSLFQPFVNDRIIGILSGAGITGLSLDMIPRITIAQTMDVLSSMASIAGYKAVILAAEHLPRYFPMLTTAAGSIPPAKVLVLGAGVAGLQAIATAKRLGAVVEAFDTRLASKEEVESLGAKFVEVAGARDDKSAGGYAVEQTDEYKVKQKQLIAEHCVKSDVIISTALLRGKPAPVLITMEMVGKMKPGSIIVDLAAGTGGNCELTDPGNTISFNGITIIGIRDLSATVPMHASQLFSRNVLNFLSVFIKDGICQLSMENEITGPSCIVYMGEPRYKKN